MTGVPRASACILLVCGLALAVGGTEVFLRQHATFVTSRGGGFLEHSPFELIRFTPKGKRLVPNAHVVIRNHYLSGTDVVMDINSRGFRDGELPGQKAPDEWRILVLGDSITWGDYLQADEVYVKRAESLLRMATPDRRVEVVNAGVGDAGLREELDLLEEQGLAIEPDVVVIAFYLNDSRPPWGFPTELEYPGWLRRHSVLAESIYRAVALDRWIKRQGPRRFEWLRASRHLDWKNDPGAFHQLAAMARYDWGAAWDGDSWVTIREGFQRLNALAAAHHFKVAIVAFPVSFQVYATFLDEELFFDQCHPRAHANELIGAALASFLRKPPGGG